MMRGVAAVALATAVGMAGCGGGAGQNASVAPSATRGSTTAPTDAVAGFIITLPSAGSQSAARRSQYISAGSKSVVITLQSVDGTAYGGPSAVTAANLAPSNPACSGTPLSCTISVPAVSGSDVFAVSLYDQQQTTTAPVSPSGNLLATATATETIVAGANLLPPITLAGVPASFSVAFATDAVTSAHVSGSAASGYTIVGDQPYTLTITTKDASGATIVGAGVPTLSTASGSLAITQVNSNTYTVQVKGYSATPIPVAISNPAGAAPSFTIATIRELWVAQFEAANVAGYALFPSCTPACPQVDALSTGLSAPTDVAFDSQGNLWVSDGTAGTLTEYARGQSTALATISLGATSGPVALTTGAAALWAAESAGSAAVEFALPASSSSTPLATVALPAAGTGVAFDSAGTLWVALANSTIRGYSGTTFNGITLSNGLTSPQRLAFDASGNLWEVDATALQKYAAPLGSASTVASTISLPGGNRPAGVAFDDAGTLYVSSMPDNAVRAYNAGGSPAPGFPLTVGAGPQGIRVRP